LQLFATWIKSLIVKTTRTVILMVTVSRVKFTYHFDDEIANTLSGRIYIYTVFQKKTSTHIIGYKLRNSCLILIIFDIKIPHII